MKFHETTIQCFKNEFRKEKVKVLKSNPENVESETYHVLCNFPR